MSDLIERMAKAAYEGGLSKDLFAKEPWEGRPEGLKDAWRLQMRRALRAARVPTAAMVSSAFDAAPTVYEDPHPLDAWQAMIDKALEEP